MKIFENKQEVFDAVWKHLHNQGDACVNYEGHCVYLNEEKGTSCAIGGILPPEIDRVAIDRELHGRPTNIGTVIKTTDIEECAMVKEVFSKIEIPFLQELQDAHDIQLRGGFLSIWRDEMRRIGRLHGLEVPKDI